MHPEDLEKGYYTSITGQTLAHARAHIAYIKHKKQLKQEVFKEMKTLLAHAPKNNKTTKNLEEALELYKNQIQEYKNEIQNTYNGISERIKNTEDYFNKAKNK